MCKKRINRLLSVILTATLTFSLAACGSGSSPDNTADETEETVEELSEGSEETEEAEEEMTSSDAPVADETRTTTADSDEMYDSISIGMISDPMELGPVYANGDSSRNYILFNFYEALFDYRDNDYVPILAKGYEEIDELHWQVEIYDYIYDSDGNHITADDVLFSIQLVIDAGGNLNYDYFESVEKIDDYTIEFTWTQPIDSIGALEWPLCRTFIISEEAYENGNFTDSPVATGPYVVTDFVSGAYVEMEANENYWQTEELRDVEHTANVQTVRYDIISETSQHVIALSTGEIDYSEYVPDENLADFEDGGQYSDGVDVYVTAGSSLYVLMANNYDTAVTSDLNVRKALFYALDNDAIATSTGSCLPVSAFGTTFFSDYNEDWESQEGNYMAAYDPELAAEYLADSSYNGETIRILCISNEISKNIATMIQALLLQIGVNAEIVAEEEALMLTDMLDPDNWELLIFAAGGSYQAGEWNRVVNYNEFSTGYNMAYIQDDTLQNYLETCKTVDGHTEENLSEMHQYILDNAYYYGLCTPQINACYNEDIAEMFFRESEFLRPGACEYYLD